MLNLRLPLLALASLVLVLSFQESTQSHLVKRDVGDEINKGLDKVNEGLSSGNYCGVDSQCTDVIEECVKFQCRFQTWFLVTIIVVPIVLLIFLLGSCFCCPCCCLYNMCRKR